MVQVHLPRYTVYIVLLDAPDAGLVVCALPLAWLLGIAQTTTG